MQSHEVALEIRNVGTEAPIVRRGVECRGSGDIIYVKEVSQAERMGMLKRERGAKCSIRGASTCNFYEQKEFAMPEAGKVTCINDGVFTLVYSIFFLLKCSLTTHTTFASSQCRSAYMIVITVR